MTDAEEHELFAAAVREHVRALSDSDFRTFVAETRPPTEPRPGDAGRREAAKRHGTTIDPEITATTIRGAAGKAAADRRFNKGERQ